VLVLPPPRTPVAAPVPDDVQGYLTAHASTGTSGACPRRLCPLDMGGSTPAKSASMKDPRESSAARVAEPLMAAP